MPDDTSTFSPTGRWIIQQELEPGRWFPPLTGYQYVYEHEAQREVDRCNRIQPGRWRLVERKTHG